MALRPVAAGLAPILAACEEAAPPPALAFRIGGRMVERPVHLGERVQAGQLIARLDPAKEQDALRSARAAVAAAEAALVEARNDHWRPSSR